MAPLSRSALATVNLSPADTYTRAVSMRAVPVSPSTLRTGVSAAGGVTAGVGEAAGNEVAANETKVHCCVAMFKLHCWSGKHT